MSAKSSFGLCGLIVCAWVLSGCGKKDEAPSSTPAVRPVKLLQVSTAGAAEVYRFPAVIGASQISELSFQVGGLLKDFPVKESQQLVRGDIIARLDQRDFKSAVASAKAQYQNANQEYQRALRLIKEDAIARNAVEQRKAQLDISKAQLDQAEKALTDSVLRSPFDGVVAQTAVKNLEAVSPGQAIVTLMSVSRFKATIDIPASLVASVPKQEGAGENRQSFVILDAAPAQLIEAQFLEADLLADTASQTYAVTFSFPPPPNLNILPGMNATVELRRNGQSQSVRVSVPMAAVMSAGEAPYVWLVDKAAMTVSKREVSVEDKVGKTLVITSGLSADDTIVGAGGAFLAEGMKIREWK